jgi:hypothetical protein
VSRPSTVEGGGSLWKIPCVQMWSNLLVKLEDFTDMINGEFVNDLASLLHDVTTRGKTQTLYDVDVKIILNFGFLFGLNNGLIDDKQS